MSDIKLPIDHARLNNLGATLFSTWDQYRTDRRLIEERWLKNLNQVRGIYDTDVKNMIPADMSKAYPKMTLWMVRGTIARLMQMLFPQTEKNYGIRPSPMPDLSTEQLQEVLDKAVKDAAGDGDPTQVVLKDEAIEKAILEFAKGKAERMEVKIQDDLDEMEFITLVRKVVRSAAIYNIGVLKGPLHRKAKARTWTRNPFTGKYTAIEVDKLKPMFEFLPVWGYYPDLTAVDLAHQDGNFERHIMTRAQVEELIDRPDFLADRIEKYLKDNTAGNYKAQWWETVMKGEPKGAQATVMAKESRKYELLSYWGGVRGSDLRAAGVDIKEEDLGKTFHANAWMIGDVLIKAKLAPLGDQIRHHHEFVFEDDDYSILGNGLPDTLRDSQLSICESTRALLDNLSVVGPSVEVNDDLLTPGQDLSIRKHKTWRREGEGATAGYPAVRDIKIDSHINELRAAVEMFLGFAEKESGLPPPSVGDMTGGGSEALRTTRNASMFLGAAALPVRDTVRNYDTFTISFTSALVAWNQKYDPNPSRDGDHNVIARGSTSLIAKEVLSQALNEFRASITPDEAPHINTRGLLVQRMKVNDLPVDELLEDEDKAQQAVAANAAQAQALSQAQLDQIHGQIAELFTRALEHSAKAKSEDASVTADSARVVIEALSAGDKTAAEHVKADTAIEAEHVKGAYAMAKPVGGANASK